MLLSLLRDVMESIHSLEVNIEQVEAWQKVLNETVDSDYDTETSNPWFDSTVLYASDIKTFDKYYNEKYLGDLDEEQLQNIFNHDDTENTLIEYNDNKLEDGDPLNKIRFAGEWRNTLDNSPRWYRIQDPNIQEIRILDNEWRFNKTKKISSGRFPWLDDQVKTSEEGKKFDDMLWFISNECDKLGGFKKPHNIKVTEVRKARYVPNGLHVFKPLAPELFWKACKELRNLFDIEDVSPTNFFSPSRVGKNKAIQGKTFLVYNMDKTRLEGADYKSPTCIDTVAALHDRGFTRLAKYAMLHVAALARLTGSDEGELLKFGGIMFIRYAPGEGFRRHIDNTSGLGHVPGPILNVAMGTEGEKIFDMQPSACHDETSNEGSSKTPIRVRTEPGESILMCNESRVEWTHCIPVGDRTTRYTMAIKLNGNWKGTNQLTYTTKKILEFLEYRQYELNPLKYVNVHLKQQISDVDQPPADVLNSKSSLLKENGDGTFIHPYYVPDSWEEWKEEYDQAADEQPRDGSGRARSGGGVDPSRTSGIRSDPARTRGSDRGGGSSTSQTSEARGSGGRGSVPTRRGGGGRGGGRDSGPAIGGGGGRGGGRDSGPARGGGGGGRGGGSRRTNENRPLWGDFALTSMDNFDDYYYT